MTSETYEKMDKFWQTDDCWIIMIVSCLKGTNFFGKNYSEFEIYYFHKGYSALLVCLLDHLTKTPFQIQKIFSERKIMKLDFFKRAALPLKSPCKLRFFDLKPFGIAIENGCLTKIGAATRSFP